MPPKRDPRRDQAADIYKQHNGRIDLAEIAEQLGVSAGTVRGWKSKDKKAWSIGTEHGSERSEKCSNRSKRSKRSERSKPVSPSAPKDSNVDKLIADAVEENEELTQQQKDFCIYYSRIRNATQAYFKAYGCAYSTANTEGPAALVNPRIKSELRRLRDIKVAALGDLCGEDVVELHMRIAFADMNYFTKYKGSKVSLMDSGETDGQLVAEVAKTRDGVKIKLADRQKSLAFLERYFELNPMDRHRKEYEARKLELALLKVESQFPLAEEDGADARSNFHEALISAAQEVWDSEEDK